MGQYTEYLEKGEGCFHGYELNNLVKKIKELIGDLLDFVIIYGDISNQNGVEIKATFVLKQHTKLSVVMNETDLWCGKIKWVQSHPLGDLH
jgi:hypothetical protein